MKKWNRPVLAELAVGFTARGDLGGEVDNVTYEINGKGSFMGTEGSSIDPNDYI
jgi:hypothetical protein